MSFIQNSLVVKRSRYEEYIWTGANDIEREGNWKWTTGDLVQEYLWNDGEPNNQGFGEHCAFFYKSKMNDVKCTRQYLFVCKMRAKKNEFKNRLKLSDHLYNIEKDLIDVKMNLSLLSDEVNKSTASTTTTTTTIQEN